MDFLRQLAKYSRLHRKWNLDANANANDHHDDGGGDDDH
jgi:hypothetical protein